MQTLTDIAIFVRVVELSSFTAAAESLELSQPVVSKAVTRLEEKLGVRLLNRTTRRLSLTEAGSELYGRCVQALMQIENAELDIARFQTEPRGLLRITAPMSFAILYLAPVLNDFMQRFPGVQIDLQMDDRQVDLVEQGLDLALRIGRLEDSNLVARRIARCRQVACASPDYLKKHPQPERPEDLIEHSCLIYSYLSTPREWRFTGQDGELIVVPIKGRLISNNGMFEREAALAGIGISLLPTFYVAEELRRGTLVPILNSYRPIELALYALYPERRNLTPKVRAFVDFLAERFGGEPPPWDEGLKI